MGREKKIYTAADFARYYSGKMPVAEMHALESDALNDPFLADALEGYQHSISTVMEAEQINNRLQDRVAGNSKKGQKGLWLRIAAMFVVMAGLGYYIYLQNDKISTKQYAQNEQASALAQPQDSLTTAGETESISAEGNKILNSPGEREEQNDQLIRVNKAHNPVVQNKLPAAENKPGNKMVDSKAFANEETTKPKMFAIEGKVTNAAGKGLAGAIVSAPVVSATVTTDSNGRFYLQSDKSNVAARISSDGYNNKEKMLNAKNEENIVLQKNAVAINMIAENAKAMARKKTSLAPVPLANNNAVPEGGLEKFALYIKQNIIPVYDTSGNSIEGKVILQFYIDALGQPENITIKKSLCSKCDLQTLQLLKNGVKWIGQENQQYQTEIDF